MAAWRRRKTGTIAVESGRHAVGESAAPGTSLSDYHVDILCRDDASPARCRRERPVDHGAGPTRLGDRLHHHEHAQAGPGGTDLFPILECVAFNDSGLDVAAWGYLNRGDDPAVVSVGPQNRFSPGDVDRGQPTVFEPDRYVGVFQTAFEASRTTLAWTLTGRTATASSASPRCTATVELRKVVIPADDPGSSNSG